MGNSTSAQRKLWRGTVASLLLLMAAIAIGSSAVQAGLPTGTSSQPSTPAPVDPSTKISAALRGQFNQAAGSKIRYIVAIAEKANVENNIIEWNAKGRYVLDALREVANRTQPPVAAALDNQKRLGNVDSYKSYYIINALGVKGNLASAQAMAALPQVALVEVFPIATLDEPVASAPGTDAPNVTEWNVDMVRAPQAWALDCNGAPCNGTGVVVGNLDTGTRHTHQALVSKYRGNLGGGNFDHNYNWWDPVTNSPSPIDGNGHGTHTTGTIVGDDGGGNQVGVAPGARWMASSGIADGTTDGDIIEAGQFMLAPWNLNMQNPDPSKRPVVVSNSWGNGVNAPACPNETFFRDVVLAWRAAGIFPSFSAGNGFPQGNRVPAAYPETFETGALNRQNVKASYSSQGPSCFDQGQHPQIMAGGGDVSAFNEDLVRSASNLADNQYSFLAGTSMAQPATAGAVAILKQANPSLTITQTWNILTSTTYFDPSWGVRPNPLYGYGRLQIDQAVLAAKALQGTPTPTVTGTPPTATATSSATVTPTMMPTNTVAPITPSATPACVIERQSSNVPLPIIDMVTISSTLTIANGPVISSVEVTNLGFEHTWAEDLDVFLVSPSGTRVELFTDICGDGDFTASNTGFTLADRGGILIGEVCPPNQGTYKPEGSLTTLIGQPSSGTWFLEVTDDGLLITGNLLSWGLRIISNTPCTTGTPGATSTATAVGATSTAVPPTQTPGGPTATLVPTGTSTSVMTVTPGLPTSTTTVTASVVTTQTPVVPTATAISTGTNTVVVPTPSRTVTLTPIVPTQTPGGLTATPMPTGTSTVVVPTITTTRTNTVVVPTLTSTTTRTVTSLPTQTPGVPTSTLVPTQTVAPTGTNTAVLPSVTPTVPVPTQTPGGPTATLVPTGTNTVVAPSATSTPLIPTSTGTVVAPSATSTPRPPTQTPGGPTATPEPPTSTATSTLVPTATSTPCTISFTDVDENNTFYTFIRCLACRGIISGYNDGTFRPFNDITRGQIAKIVSNAAGFDEDPGPQVYEDVDETNPFYQWINRLSNRGHMGGYPCGTVDAEPCLPPAERPYFRPFSNSTRGQLAKIVSNAAGIGGTPSEVFYTDVQEDNPFYVWIMRLTELGVMSGYDCGGPGEPCDDQNRPYFRPFNNVTRGQASKIVANTFYPDCETPMRR